MRAARAQDETRLNFERVCREATVGVKPALDDDAPDSSALTREVIAKRRADEAKCDGKAVTTPEHSVSRHVDNCRPSMQ